MKGRRPRRLAVLTFLWAVVPAGSLAGQGLPVPFVPQEALLCGGASAAMVLRWHGVRGVHPADWGHLVRPEEGGIRTDDLAESFRERGWAVQAGAGDTAALASALAADRPPIVLLGEGEVRYHYVTVVGLDADGVWVHDPSIGPGIRIEREDFERRWHQGGRWTMLAQPPPPGPGRATAPAGTPVPPSVPEAAADTTSHPGSDGATPPSPSLEAPLLRASERFRAGDWQEAARWAEAAAGRPDAGPSAWKLLAVSRYLADDPKGALEAWQRAGGLELDLVRVEGPARTRTTLIHRLAGLHPGDPLTGGELSRARRRVGLLPTAVASRVAYRPVDATRAEVEVVVVERPVVPHTASALAATAARALVRRDGSLTVSSALGLGETVTIEARWNAAAPRLAATAALPDAFGLPGVTRISLERRSERWAGEGVDGLTRAALRHDDWLSGEVGWWGEIGWDAWRDGRSGPAGGGGLRWRPAHDRLDVSGSVSLGWRSGAEAFATSSVEAAWRSTTEPEGWVTEARSALVHASEAAPRLLWPGAGSGTVRPWLLRAHPLIRGDALAGPALGRTLATAGAELVRWTPRLAPLRVGVAGFLDGAWAGHRPPGATPGALQLDVGAGLRIELPGAPGRLTLDGAVGLRDGRTALSLGWRSSWPR